MNEFGFGQLDNAQVVCWLAPIDFSIFLRA